MVKKLTAMFLAAMLCFTTLLACGRSDKNAEYELPYYDELDEGKGFNEELFRYNAPVTTDGDPGVIRVTDPEDPYYGWFYMYTTTGISGVDYPAYRSRDLYSWEYADIAYKAEDGNAARSSVWAPEVIYDEVQDKYYMFISARDIYYEVSDYRYPYGFKNLADKAKYWHYSDWVKLTYPAYGSTGDVASKNEESIDGLWAQLDARYAALTDASDGINDGVYIDDEGIAGENGYKTAYTEKQIQSAIDAYLRMKVMIEGSNKNEYIDYLQGALIDMWTMDCKPVSQESTQACYIAVSDNPQGPFVCYTNDGSDGNRALTKRDAYISTEELYEALRFHRPEWYKGVEQDYGIIEEHYEDDGQGNLTYVPDQKVEGQMLAERVGSTKLAWSCRQDTSTYMNDISPFVDPATGDKYLYICKTCDANGENGWIVGVKIGDKNSKWTDDPMWETVTRLTRRGYYTTDEISEANWSQNDLQEGKLVNEGPFMIYNENNGKYYLTMSVNSFFTRTYAVIQAVGDSPLGPFRKLTKDEGGLVICSPDNWDHIAGPGHHCLVNVDGKTYAVYQKWLNPANDNFYLGGGRGIVFDPVVWAKNGNGLEVLHLNGPTLSPQPKVGLDAKYDNIASFAKVTANNVASDSSVDYLVDNVIKIYEFDEWIKEFTTGSKQSTTITMKFDDYRTVRALMLYNSVFYDTHFNKVDKIELDFKKVKDGKEVFGTAYIKDLLFDEEDYVVIDDVLGNRMRPGAAAIAEFEELAVKEIRITFKSKTAIAVSEIVVLGA